MKTALAHHWIMSYRGGEKVLEQVASLVPDADVYLLTHDRSIDVPGIRNRKVYTSELGRVPRIEKLYKHLLPMHPWAIKRMKVPSDVDLLISSDASMIKGINTAEFTKHVCYCHSPPRYLWEMGDEYTRGSWLARAVLNRCSARLKRFDHDSAQKVDHFIANSKFVAERIRKYYGRDAKVVYPPVATEDFQCDRKRDSFHMVLSELTPYKRIDIAVRAYTQLGKRLVIVGDGSERAKLEAMAGPTIEFLGRQSFSVLRNLLQTCEAFVFPGVEDFGITPVEAQASGSPVIAFRAGGALETVVEHHTGLFFDEQTPDSLIETLTAAESRTWDSQKIREHAETFSTPLFEQNFLKALEEFGCPINAPKKPATSPSAAILGFTNFPSTTTDSQATNP